MKRMNGKKNEVLTIPYQHSRRHTHYYTSKLKMLENLFVIVIQVSSPLFKRLQKVVKGELHHSVPVF